MYYSVCTILRFEWDEAKNQSNLAKHDVDFGTAQGVFDDSCCVVFVERVKDCEERWHAIGSVEGILILTVVRTYREEGSDEIIRIVSARQASAHERRLYAQALG
jgi:uncharacterized DUF497 family protein